MATLVLDDVTKVFPGGVVAVEGLSLEVPDGRLTVLIGPSGCGKTTVLRLAAGLETPTRGRIVLDGRDMAGVAPRDRDVAMVFEGQALYPHFNVGRNIAFGLRLRRAPRAEIASRVAETARAMEIEELLSRMPAALSGGQRRRVALARALVRRPKVLLLDEPLAHLDPRLRERLRDEIRRLHATLGLTMLLVTHHEEDATCLGQRVAVMRQGRILQEAAPDALYDRPANRFVAELIGRPGMNLLAGRLERAGDRLRLCAGAIVLDLPDPWPSRLGSWAGREVFLGVRPEDLLPTTGLPSDGMSLSATVEHLDRLGADWFLRLRTGPLELTARAGPSDSAAPTVGQTIPLVFRAGRLHFFDRATGNTLRTAGSDGAPWETR